MSPTTDTTRDAISNEAEVQELNQIAERLKQTITDIRDRFNTFMDNSPAVAWIKDENGHYTYTNKPWEQLFLRKGEKWQGRTDYDIWPESVANELRANDQTVLSTGKVLQLSEQVPLPDGSYPHWLVFKFPIVNAKSERFVGGMAFDITDYKQAETSLRQSEERIRLIIDTALDAVITIDTTGAISEWNKQAETIFGWNREEVLGRDLAETIIPPDLRAAHRAGLQRYLESGEGPYLNRRFELSAIRRNGDIFPVELAISPMRTDGQLSFSGFIRDISERKRAEEAVRQSQQRYESLVNSIDGIVWEATVDTCKFTFVSKRAERILGFPTERWISEPQFWIDHMHPEDREWAVKYCGDETAKMRDHEFEYRMIAADGRIVWLHDYVTVIVEHDEPAKIRGIMVDVTTRKQAEDQVRRSEERYRLLLSELDHRVRNNLASLSALVDLSSRGQQNVPSFAESFKGRIQAISQVHNLLSHGQWSSVTLKNLIKWLSPTERHEAIGCTGPDIRVTQRKLTSFGIVLHELITNSLKYGALSVDQGRIELTWTTRELEKREHIELKFTWKESNGPRAHSQPIPGVGSELISGLVRSELQGDVQLSYPSTGALHKLRVVLDCV